MILIDPAPDSRENLALAHIVAEAGGEDYPLKLTRARDEELPSASERARLAGAADLTIVIQLRRGGEGRVAVDRRRPASLMVGTILAQLLQCRLDYWTHHEVFGHRDRTAHGRPVVLVGSTLGIPLWLLAAGVLQGLDRAHA